MKCKNCKNLIKRIDSDGILYDSCEIIVDCPDTERERDCKYYVVATNADKIRAMSNDELAMWLERIRLCCSTDLCGRNCPFAEVCYSSAEAPKETLDWLKQEAE